MRGAGRPRRVLFLCTHNAARSQMAEAWLRVLGGERFEAASAGTEPTVLHPLAVRAMAEVGIDLSGHRAKGLDAVGLEGWDDVITVCDAAAGRCPAFPGRARRLHWSVPDPAAVAGPEAQRLAAFRRAREELGSRVRAWLAAPDATG